MGSRVVSVCFAAFQCFDFHFVLLRSLRFDDFGWFSNKVSSRPMPLNHQLALTAVNSAVVIQAGHVVNFVSVHRVQRTRNGVLDTFALRNNAPAARTVPLLPYKFERQ